MWGISNSQICCSLANPKRNVLINHRQKAKRSERICMSNFPALSLEVWQYVSDSLRASAHIVRHFTYYGHALPRGFLRFIAVMRTCIVRHFTYYRHALPNGFFFRFIAVIIFIITRSSDRNLA